MGSREAGHQYAMYFQSVHTVLIKLDLAVTDTHILCNELCDFHRHVCRGGASSFAGIISCCWWALTALFHILDFHV